MSEQYKGQYAPELFDEQKRYYLLQAQQRTNLTDAELRDLNSISNTATRRFIQTEIGDAVAIDTGFKITENPSDQTNNFLITGGTGLENPGAFYLKGYRFFLTEDITYKDQTNNGDTTTVPPIDGYTATALPALTTPVGSTTTINDLILNGSILSACDASGKILKSGDWGRSWTTLSVSSNALSAISYGNATIGYAVGDAGAVYKTTNSGSTWIPIFPSGYGSTNFYGASFVNASAGWIVGSSGTILFTSNSGSTWSPCSGISTTLTDIDSSGNLKAWAVGHLGTIAHTTNTLWTNQSSGTLSNLNGIQSIDGATLYVVGDDGTVLKTTNGGSLWSSIGGFTASNLKGLYFSDAQNGWVVGDNGVVAHTTDGATWNSRIIKSDVNFETVIFDSTVGFIAGTNGQIYRTLNDGTTWERYRTDYAYVDFHLAEVCADATSGSEYIDTGLQDSTVGLPRSNRLRAVSDVKVSEGWPWPSDYTNGAVQHYTTPLAKIQRHVNQSSVYATDITDLRKVVRTIAEIDNLFFTGGIDSSALAPGSVTPDKLDSTADYTVGALDVSGDALIEGSLTVQGAFNTKDGTFNNLTVNGSTILGDSTKPYDTTVQIYGQVIQSNDVPAPTYTMQVDASTGTFPVFDIDSDGSGNIFNIVRTSHTTLALMDVTNYGQGYDFHVAHLGTQGGAFSIQDHASNDTIVIDKSSATNAGSVVSITSNSVDPVINIVNVAPGSNSISIDQTHGVMVDLYSAADATALSIASLTGGRDIQISHLGTRGSSLSINSNSRDSVIDVTSASGPTMRLTQQANESALIVSKDGTGSGQGIEIYNHGSDVGLGIYNDGTGIGQLISHVGPGNTNAGLDIYVGGPNGPTGPALRINKANDESGEAIKILNQGYGEAIFITQDATTHDSSTTIIRLHNGNYPYSFDMSSDHWWIDNSGNFFGKRYWLDSTQYHIDSTSIWLDALSMDASNPGIIGQVFREQGFLRISDGSNVLPPFGMGATGIQGLTGIGGLGGPGATGISGVTGISGLTGIQGITGTFYLSQHVDGGFANSVYLPIQYIDGGGA
jgi:photosystem II stability/assembly factor-like uncharacterized protein